MLRAVVVCEAARTAIWREALQGSFDEVAVGLEAAMVEPHRTVVIGESDLSSLPRGLFGWAAVAPASWPVTPATNFMLAFCESLEEAVGCPPGTEVVVSPYDVINTLERACAAPRANPRGPSTVLGFGSLLSEASARTTFPKLSNFRLVRLRGWRRVFAHSPSVFFERGIADAATGEVASLSVEVQPDASIIVAAFDVDIDQDAWDKFCEREEEFDILEVPYDDARNSGILCTRSSDAAYVAKWGRDRYDAKYKHLGSNIWDHPRDSNLRPCAVYLRHCVLAVTKAGPLALDSFLDDTFLVDRTTPLRAYLAANPHVMDARPPPDLASRYSG
ncbi:hypothetical protein CTAYLR_005130 [Chrysophaeum taylorii]|uniref:Uncharacterized protein n=1 Tax=Chrysophaeum taylorii TaxID=2483200 RepID=A0AAD7UDU5_9STRA|nr:hypothetical protein CTAYLR_005130 [Chrysophaeum taylorii]